MNDRDTSTLPRAASPSKDQRSYSVERPTELPPGAVAKKKTLRMMCQRQPRPPQLLPGRGSRQARPGDSIPKKPGAVGRCGVGVAGAGAVGVSQGRAVEDPTHSWVRRRESGKFACIAAQIGYRNNRNCHMFFVLMRVRNKSDSNEFSSRSSLALSTPSCLARCKKYPETALVLYFLFPTQKSKPPTAAGRAQASAAAAVPTQPADGPSAMTTPARPTQDDVLACQFSSWYRSFRNIDKSAINNSTARKTRKNVTFESIVIKPLPHEFLEYLKSDGVRLPDCATKVSSCMNDNATPDDDEWETDSDDETTSYSFPSLTAQIQTALDSLNGDRDLGCMPKMNWSSPRDATWMNQGSLKCTKVGDVYLLLKSSEFVTFDVERAFDDLAEDDSITGGYPDCFSHELVLRKWCNLHPSMEFRCFVRGHDLVAISQRHPSKFYGHLQPPVDGSAHPCAEMISSFFATY
ncbi:hypothetical protein THAOC_30403, partial [Thalassiosira oceanica]